MSFSSKRRLIHTLADISPNRLQRRLRSDVRQRLDRKLPIWLVSYWAGVNGITPEWHSKLQSLEIQSFPPTSSTEFSSVSFDFLQMEKELSWPIPWNDANWPRLWQFHLHYFDWAREWLEFVLVQGHWPDQAALLEPLIDHWIEDNPLGGGDGWHSYTLSLRIRNWIWLFRCCPRLATRLRLDALWQQLCWLQSHPEHANGGNHWLENLTALSLGGLQFEGPEAQSLHSRSMRLLQQELASQVLDDGGHEERSASYHLLMLDRLVELACSLSAVNGECPSWLVRAIEAMTVWAKAVRLEGGAAPRFNDSAVDIAPQLDDVVCFAEAYLHQRHACSGLRRKLLQSVAKIPTSALVTTSSPVSDKSVSNDLPSTGWSFLRPGHGWELVFRCGVPCPLHLPAGHVHSDQLSFDLSFKGQWIISEAGTSTYSTGPVRTYERSGKAHNVLQIGLAAASGKIHWIEPVEVWGGFRAGRKALPLERLFGELRDGSCFAAGSHDGYDRINVSHDRRVQLSNSSSNQVTLTVDERVITRHTVYFRQWWHLAPSVPKELMNGLAFEAPTAQGIQTGWHPTWFSERFGQRTSRKSFCISGCLPPGEHQLSAILSLSVITLSRSVA